MTWFKLFNAINNSSIRLFCFHYGGGSASVFRKWLKDLTPIAELIAIQLPGREDRFNEPLIYDVSHVVDKLCSDMGDYLNKPFVFFGHSVGALIAFEFARLLRKKGMQQPKHFIVSGARAPQRPIERKLIHNLPDSQFIEELKKYNGISPDVIEDKELINLFLPVIRADFSISETYKYAGEIPFDYPLTALSGVNDNTFEFSSLLGWKKQTTNIFIHYSLPGDHFFIKSSYNKVIQIVNQILNKENDKNILYQNSKKL
jgi:medium-chain acyl-[acyl-carrier-protein] hydrolase